VIVKLDAKISGMTRDSVNEFATSFIHYIDKHCCEYMFGCPQSNQYLHSPIINTWNSVNQSLPFHATLKLTADHTFSYHGRGCDVVYKADGAWISLGDSMILTSTNPEECYRTIPFGVNCFAIDSPTLVHAPFEKPCSPSVEETYVIFDRALFFLESDTLMHKANLSTACPEIKYMFVKESDVKVVN